MKSFVTYSLPVFLLASAAHSQSTELPNKSETSAEAAHRILDGLSACFGAIALTFRDEIHEARMREVDPRFFVAFRCDGGMDGSAMNIPSTPPGQISNSYVRYCTDAGGSEDGCWNDVRSAITSSLREVGEE